MEGTHVHPNVRRDVVHRITGESARTIGTVLLIHISLIFKFDENLRKDNLCHEVLFFFPSPRVPYAPVGRGNIIIFRGRFQFFKKK